MAKIEVVLPQMGEGIIEATITRWLVDLNAFIEEDDPIIEIATDKVDSEIPAPAAGKLVKQFFSEGEIPKVGDVIAIIEDGNENNNVTEAPLIDSQVSKESKNVAKGSASEQVVSKRKIVATSTLFRAEQEDVVKASLFIRNFAKVREISSEELASIKGSGKDGNIIKEDIYSYIEAGRPFKKINSAEILTSIEEPSSHDYAIKEGEELIELDRTRQLIAQHMVHSIQTAPHVTSFVEVDITTLVEWREAIKTEFKTKHGFSITYTPILTDVVVKALKEYPDINVSLLSKNMLIKKKYINIGIATALPDGNLIVPVVKDADKKNLKKLASDIADKTSRARKGALMPGETKGGTFTITNLGQVGNVTGTPIINQPESAILAVGAIKKKPGVVKIKSEYTIGVRDIVTLSLSYDHRIIDGALGGAFLSRIGELLENYKPEL